MAKENPGNQSPAATYDLVKAAFRDRGSSFTAWCREHGHGHANVRAAILGAWTGPKADALVATVIRESGVQRQ